MGLEMQNKGILSTEAEISDLASSKSPLKKNAVFFT